MAVRSRNIWHGFTWQLLSPAVPSRSHWSAPALGTCCRRAQLEHLVPGEVLHPSNDVLFAYEEMSLGQMAAWAENHLCLQWVLAALPHAWLLAPSAWAWDGWRIGCWKPRGSAPERDNARIGPISWHYGTSARGVLIQKSSSSLRPLTAQEQAALAVSPALCLRQLLFIWKLLRPDPRKTWWR